MKVYYKVYAQCVNTPKRIIKLTKENVSHILSDESFYNSEYGDIVKWNWIHENPNDDDSDITQECMDAFYSYIYERLFELLNKLGYVDCGDFRIVEIDEDDYPNIPNACRVSMAEYI